MTSGLPNSGSPFYEAEELNSAVSFTDQFALVGYYADDVLEHKLIDVEL